LVETFDLAAGLWVIRAGVDVVDAKLAENDLQGGAAAAPWCGGEDGAVEFLRDVKLLLIV
jgi:hypothetical protein